MPRDLDLPRRLRLAGLDVTLVDGWDTRGSENFHPRGSVHHHTAGARHGTQPSLGVCANGRADLPGPLCNVFGPREESLRVILVAAGRANHAGPGGYGGLSGNSSVYGLEEEHVGTAAEPVSELRIDRMARVHAAFAFGRFTDRMVCQHREWAPRRKPDFTAAWIDADDFRSRVAHHLDAMATPEVPDMTKGYVLVRSHPEREHELPANLRGRWWWITPAERAWCPTPGAAKEAVRLGLCDNADPILVSPTFIREKRPIHPIDAGLPGGGPHGHFPEG